MVGEEAVHTDLEERGTSVRTKQKGNSFSAVFHFLSTASAKLYIVFHNVFLCTASATLYIGASAGSVAQVNQSEENRAPVSYMCIIYDSALPRRPCGGSPHSSNTHTPETDIVHTYNCL